MYTGYTAALKYFKFLDGLFKYLALKPNIEIIQLKDSKAINTLGAHNSIIKRRYRYKEIATKRDMLLTLFKQFQKISFNETKIYPQEKQTIPSAQPCREFA